MPAMFYMELTTSENDKYIKNLEQPPGRPIVASTGSILSPLSIFLEKILTPMIPTTPSFLLGTGDFLKTIQQLDKVPTESYLVTFNVKDLYTSIPHQHGIESVNKLLSQAGMIPDQANLCLELLSIVRTKKNVLFQDRYYLQNRGTAMGSNVAPPYANCYMADYKSTVIYASQLYQDNVLMWNHFIDEIFCIWQGTAESLHLFFQLLNSS
ncbi:unnamed protein product [Ranitomeya imitator]|uniref:Reverse transcriptase domain-containing protein n=1 Tax=Ranitomeya imitator TaxID=111125 RepID=A0ABN9KWI2_9NEOB|nr:unnamed protein product [Ranitomeya imitator]